MTDHKKPVAAQGAQTKTKTNLQSQASNKSLKAQLKPALKHPDTGIEKLPVIILTDRFRIKCKVNLVRGMRLTDFIRSEQDFIPVLNAEVWSLESRQKIISTEFLNISKAHIQIITPDNLVGSKPKDFDIPDAIR